MSYKYKILEENDIDRVMEIFEDGKEYLRIQGNGQWQDGYPNRDIFLNDIKNHRLFGILDRDNENIIVAICAITYYEEDYDHLYEGSWLSNYDYLVIHRTSVKKEYRNMGYGHDLFALFIDTAKQEGYHSLRVDTHEKNTNMRHVIESAGFTYCGRAILKPNKDRVVYEKII